MVSFFSGPQNIKRLYPIFIDLKRYSGGRKQVQDTHDAGSLLQQILQAGGAPRRTLRELERLAKEGRVLALIDGLNEVSSEIRMKIVDYFLSVNKSLKRQLQHSDKSGSLWDKVQQMEEYMQTFGKTHLMKRGLSEKAQPKT